MRQPPPSGADPRGQARARLGAGAGRPGRAADARARRKVAYVQYCELQPGRARRAPADARAPLPPRRRGLGARSAGQRRRAAERGRADRRACSSPRASWSSPPTAEPRAARIRGRRRAARPAHPTVVLINRDTASAAEILASALGDHDLATIVGTRSFGKGTFQEVIELDAGGALDLTVGEYFTADGRSLAGKGIRPEVRAEGRSEDGDSIRPGSGGAERRGLQRALQVLGRKLGQSSEPPRRREVGRRGWSTVERRGRFTVAEPLFERGPRVDAGSGLDRRRRPARSRWSTSARAAPAPCARSAPPERARDVVAALLWDRGMDRGFAAALESEAGEAAARRARRRWRVATSPSSPRSPSTRRRRATSTTPSRPRPRATACGSGST